MVADPRRRELLAEQTRVRIFRIGLRVDFMLDVCELAYEIVHENRVD